MLSRARPAPAAPMGFKLPDGVKRTALAIETFHKASLVHDDIEDDDTFRYGRATLHRQYGVGTAINVGDYLIGLGYRLVARERKELGGDCTADILNKLSEAHLKLSEGQGAELLWRDAGDKALTALDALKIYALKTAPAFEAALYAGLRLAGPADSYEKMVTEFSKNLGVAFQVLNDLKDWEGDGENKRVAGGDVLAARPTLLLALALEGLPPAEREELLTLLRREDNTPQAHGSQPAGSGCRHHRSRRPTVHPSRRVRQGREARGKVPGQSGRNRRRRRTDRTPRVALLPGRFRPRPSTAAGTGTGDASLAANRPMNPPAILHGPRLNDLLSLFPTADDFQSYETVLPEEVPSPYRELLVHEHHMTVTVEEYHGDKVDVVIYNRRHDGPYYARRIFLALKKSRRIVQYGLVRINLRYCSPEVRAEIIAGQTPLGRILINHDVLRRIEPTGFLRMVPGPELMKAFGLTEPTPTYGRLAYIHCNEQPAIELLEVVAPV